MPRYGSDNRELDRVISKDPSKLAKMPPSVRAAWIERKFKEFEQNGGTWDEEAGYKRDASIGQRQNAKPRYLQFAERLLNKGGVDY